MADFSDTNIMHNIIHILGSSGKTTHSTPRKCQGEQARLHATFQIWPNHSSRQVIQRF